MDVFSKIEKKISFWELLLKFKNNSEASSLL